MDETEAKRAAAEARRQRLLARGKDRLDAITGSVASTPEKEGPGDAFGSSEMPPPTPSAPTTQTKSRSTAGDEAAAGAPRQRKGTAADAKWSSYEQPSAPAKSGGQANQLAKPLSLGESLTAAVRLTAPARLLVAALLALLLSVAWDVQAARAAAPAPAPSGPAALMQDLAGLGSATWQYVTDQWQRLRTGNTPLQTAPTTVSLQQLLTKELPGMLYSKVEAAIETPAGQTAVAQLERLPPLLSVMLVNASLLAAALVAVLAVPGMVRKRFASGRTGLVARLLSLVPGLAQQLELVSGFWALAEGAVDDAAAFLFVLVLYRTLPLALASVQ